MDTKWVTFRLQEGPGREARYRGLLEAVREIDEGAWDEPTSFFLVQTELSTADVARRLADRILQTEDVLLVGSVTTRGVVVVGNIRAEQRLRRRIGDDLRTP
jgi:hypothetical protein